MNSWSNLPGCVECLPHGPLGYRVIQRGDMSAVEFCSCEKGQARREQEKRHRSPVGPGFAVPVLTISQAQIFVERLDMPDYPRSGVSRGEIGDELRQLCSSVEQADWLVKRMHRLFQRWPGIPVMRIVLGSAYLPLDGVTAGECGTLGCCEQYPLGIPSERPPVEDVKLLGPGPRSVEVSAAPSLQLAIASVAELKDLNRFGPRGDVSPIPSQRSRTITGADVDAAIAQLHETKRLLLDTQAEQEWRSL